MEDLRAGVSDGGSTGLLPASHHAVDRRAGNVVGILPLYRGLHCLCCRRCPCDDAASQSSIEAEGTLLTYVGRKGRDRLEPVSHLARSTSLQSALPSLGSYHSTFVPHAAMRRAVPPLMVLLRDAAAAVSSFHVIVCVGCVSGSLHSTHAFTFVGIWRLASASKESAIFLVSTQSVSWNFDEFVCII